MKPFVVSMFIAALGLCGMQALAQSKVHYPDEFPEHGREVLATVYADASISHVGKGGKSGVGDVFYVTGLMDDKKLELILTKEGEVYEDLRVTDIPLSDVPAGCWQAAQEKVPGIEIATAERVERGDAVEYRLSGAFIEEEKDPDVATQDVVWLNEGGEVLQNYRKHKIGPCTPKPKSDSTE